MATDSVYKYLKLQNRPYSVNDIVSNLHNEHGKSVVQKAVDQLVTDGKIFEKVYGKQKIYCVVQDSKYDKEELMRIDKELQAHANEVESKYKDLEKEIKAQEGLLSTLKASITTEEAEREKIALEESIGQLSRRLDQLMESTGNQDMSETKRKAEKALNDYSREYAKRKRMCTEILDAILESFPESKSKLYEDIGIETKIVQ